MGNIIVNIAKDYSRCPGARYNSEGDFSGEKFREELLKPKINEAIEQGVKLEVVLDGSAGYSTSFLEEAFGGLIRTDKMDLKVIKENLIIISDEDPSYAVDVNLYLENAWNHRN